MQRSACSRQGDQGTDRRRRLPPTSARYADETGKIIGEMVEAVREADPAHRRNRRSLAAQSAGVDEINHINHRLGEEMTQQNAAMAEEASAAASSLEDEAVHLDESVRRFTLGRPRRKRSAAPARERLPALRVTIVHNPRRSATRDSRIAVAYSIALICCQHDMTRY